MMSMRLQHECMLLSSSERLGQLMLDAELGFVEQAAQNLGDGNSSLMKSVLMILLKSILVFLPDAMFVYCQADVESGKQQLSNHEIFSSVT
ncbi:hypothetical protein MIR68_000448 [Amoeboaphelidium protococcarum]|nr:hypothetical protein MIR68_000448 [Amoeboaphelidium protococcarum]